jgi:hypothetical protein
VWPASEKLVIAGGAAHDGQGPDLLPAPRAAVARRVSARHTARPALEEDQ